MNIDVVPYAYRTTNHLMNKSQMSKIEFKAFELGEKIQEVGLSIQTALVALNPVTNAIYTAYSEWSIRKSMRQLEVMMKELSMMLENVEEGKVGILQSDEFKELLYKTCQKVVADLREEKASLFGDFLAGTVTHEDIPASDHYMMLETLDKLDLEHIAFLAKMEPRAIDPSEQSAGWTSDDSDLAQLGISEERFFLLSDYLSNLGLVTRLEKFNVDQTKGHLIMWREYYLSTFGKTLLKLLKQ